METLEKQLKLNIQNPESLIYENDLLRVTVLGGIKIEGMDRMRATLKIEIPQSPKPAIRHNLDLYNDNQLEKIVRKTAERLEIGTSVVTACLNELTEQLENYRLAESTQAIQTPGLKILSNQEQEEALNYLKQKNLIFQTQIDLEKTGIIGEEKNALLLYIAMTSRKCNDPLSVVCLAKSGTGKSYLMEKVAACFPWNELLENTQFTQNSFYYYKREEIRGKILLIEDLDGAQDVLYPIRELQSKKRISKTVTTKDKNGQLRTITLMVEGPVCVVGCTTQEKIFEDNANRSLLIYLDGGKEQDHKIIEYQKLLKAGLINKEMEKDIQLKLQNIQLLLEPIKIINPYAPLINLPQTVFKPRRTIGLLLNFIEAITYFHQHQRTQKVDKSTGEIYIETTPEDIEWGFKLLEETLFRKSDELSGACRTFYDLLKNELIKKIQSSNLQKSKEKPSTVGKPSIDGKEIKKDTKKEKESTTQKVDKNHFYARDIREFIRINPRTLNRYLLELSEFNYLEIVGGNKFKTGFSYRLNPFLRETDLQTLIKTEIEQILIKVRDSSTPNKTGKN